MRFEDRAQAGVLLGEAVARLEPRNPVVLALPRGGVPVGFEVARTLSCPLDVLLVRKLGTPGRPELAMGAVAEGDVVIRNQDIIALARVGEDQFGAVLDGERKRLAARAATYRDRYPAFDPGGHTALVVDDGLATGATAAAAVEAVRMRGADSVWLCVPVAPAEARDMDLADRFVVLHTPDNFVAVGMWYQRFGQTSDEEVRELLAASRLR